MWILTSTLSEDVRGLPDMVETNDQNDAIYQGLLTVIISLIYLSNGMLPEGARNPLQELTFRIVDSIFETSRNPRVYAIDVYRETLGYNGKARLHR